MDEVISKRTVTNARVDGVRGVVEDYYVRDTIDDGVRQEIKGITRSNEEQKSGGCDTDYPITRLSDHVAVAQ